MISHDQLAALLADCPYLDNYPTVIEFIWSRDLCVSEIGYANLDRAIDEARKARALEDA